MLLRLRTSQPKNLRPGMIHSIATGTRYAFTMTLLMTVLTTLLHMFQANVSPTPSSTLMAHVTCANMHAGEDVSDLRTAIFVMRIAMAIVLVSMLISA